MFVDFRTTYYQYYIKSEQNKIGAIVSYFYFAFWVPCSSISKFSLYMSSPTVTKL